MQKNEQQSRPFFFKLRELLDLANHDFYSKLQAIRINHKQFLILSQLQKQTEISFSRLLHACELERKELGTELLTLTEKGLVTARKDTANNLTLFLSETGSEKLEACQEVDARYKKHFANLIDLEDSSNKIFEQLLIDQVTVAESIPLAQIGYEQPLTAAIEQEHEQQQQEQQQESPLKQPVTTVPDNPVIMARVAVPAAEARLDGSGQSEKENQSGITFEQIREFARLQNSPFDELSNSEHDIDKTNTPIQPDQESLQYEDFIPQSLPDTAQIASDDAPQRHDERIKSEPAKDQNDIIEVETEASKILPENPVISSEVSLPTPQENTSAKNAQNEISSPVDAQQILEETEASEGPSDFNQIISDIIGANHSSALSSHQTHSDREILAAFSQTPQTDEVASQTDDEPDKEAQIAAFFERKSGNLDAASENISKETGHPPQTNPEPEKTIDQDVENEGDLSINLPDLSAGNEEVYKNKYGINEQSPDNFTQLLQEELDNELEQNEKDNPLYVETESVLETNALNTPKPFATSKTMDDALTWLNDIIYRHKGTTTASACSRKILGEEAKEFDRRLFMTLATQLEQYNVGIVPDPRYSMRGQIYKNGCYLFSLPDEVKVADLLCSREYRQTSLVLHTGLCAAHSGYEDDDAELDVLEKYIENNSELTRNEKARLHAELDSKRYSRLSLKPVKNLLKSMPDDQKGELVDFVREIILADNNIEDEEISLFRKLHKILGLKFDIHTAFDGHKGAGESLDRKISSFESNGNTAETGFTTEKKTEHSRRLFEDLIDDSFQEENIEEGLFDPETQTGKDVEKNDTEEVTSQTASPSSHSISEQQPDYSNVKAELSHEELKILRNFSLFENMNNIQFEMLCQNENQDSETVIENVNNWSHQNFGSPLLKIENNLVLKNEFITWNQVFSSEKISA